MEHVWGYKSIPLLRTTLPIKGRKGHVHRGWSWCTGTFVDVSWHWGALFESAVNNILVLWYEWSHTLKFVLAFSCMQVNFVATRWGFKWKYKPARTPSIEFYLHNSQIFPIDKAQVLWEVCVAVAARCEHCVVESVVVPTQQSYRFASQSAVCPSDGFHNNTHLVLHPRNNQQKHDPRMIKKHTNLTGALMLASVPRLP